MNTLKRILWCITGAGGYLHNIYDIFVGLRVKYPELEIGVVFSQAGWEVARIYGILDKIDRVATGGRYGGVYHRASSSGIVEDGTPLGGRVSLRRYDVIVIAPATSNTVAKIVHGIADTLPTIAVSQALKSGVPVIVFPSDYDKRSVTHLPCYINKDLCIRCLLCVKECPYNAIYHYEPQNIPRINYNECRGCGICAEVCPVDAIKCWEEQVFTPSQIDLENLRKLEETRGIQVVKSPSELQSTLEKILRGR